ncbi:quinone-dependent dihydroorotate dehydrogenase [Emticicia sp. C21]|uniref:quinone-dependent dihydroorotate dehydrogenase n=1 Tax=Emticicia sp. C21 TaxID=2302915 RepID=UPI000E34AC26|nr:quinone-dependent dihydroorotate dehydrogenase [Emticicia sp. C21]RFS15911.1 quinone-dependent dihydroorotate dehydrogenase [Emticicia sp. C21]
MSFYKKFVFPYLTRQDAEKIHYLVMDVLKFACKIPFMPAILRLIYEKKDPRLERKVFGLRFKNPVGLAAGFDKNGLWTDELSNLGFGFVEIGTVTPRAQMGNDKPRLFRLKQDEALINRMGFNNEGSGAAANQLRKRKTKIIVGGNIGKNKLTKNDDAVYDYLKSFNDLYPYVDYFVINVSSPNTPGLRALQEKDPLKYLLKTLERDNGRKSKPKPILLKIAPDLTDEQLDDIIEIVKETRISGVIASNTTISREGLVTDKAEVDEIGAGGLSGKPLAKRSTEVIRYLSEKSKKAFPIIGVGGIHSAEDAIEKLKAGASLVQVYSGFIYEGPGIVKDICEGILKEKF